MKRRSLAILVAIAAASPTWSAQVGPPSASQEVEIDPAAIAAAREMIAATDYQSQIRNAAQLTAQSTFSTVLQQIETQHGIVVPQELEAELRVILQDHVEAYVASLNETILEDSARIYARYFTADELRELQRLQTHPVMMKFQRIAPQFMAELNQVGMAEAVRRLPELERRVGEAVAEWMARQRLDGRPPRT